ncbi:MAG: dTMP kinase [Eubacteriales bacterium]|nr:dTMP kinase [Eubacteriales bacterium]
MSLFITFEGIDGCGKSTQLELFRKYLSDRGIRNMIIREPGGTSIGERIREILLDKINTGMTPETELLLFEASRAQIVREVIKPEMSSGTVVICDRFADSTTAYQGYGRRIGSESVRMINEYATDGLKPDITYLFDIDPVDASQRMDTRDREIDRLDSESRDFIVRVREGYLQIAGEDPGRVRVIDAGKSIEKIAGEIIRIYEEVSGNETCLRDR